MNNLKVGMLILMEHDVEQAVTFYKNLGFPLTFHLKDQWAEFEMAGVKLGLCPTNGQVEKRTGIVFEVADLKSFYQKLKSQGVQFLGEPIERVHGLMVSFKDPGNNILDLYQPTPEKVRGLVQNIVREEGKGGCCGGQGTCKCQKN